jgi:hypothetical protein
MKSIKQLLQTHSSIIEELKSRNVLRTRNNPVADFSEWLIAKSLRLTLEGNSKAGYDAIDKKKIRYQIKGRRIVPENKSTQLGVIRNLDKKNFDYLIGIIFDNDYTALYAAKIPHFIVSKFAKFSKHQNGHILHLKKDIFADKRVKNITKLILSDY